MNLFSPKKSIYETGSFPRGVCSFQRVASFQRVESFPKGCILSHVSLCEDPSPEVQAEPGD